MRKGFHWALRFPPSSKSTHIWRVCLSMGIWFPPTTVPLTKFKNSLTVSEAPNSRVLRCKTILSTFQDKMPRLQVPAFKWLLILTNWRRMKSFTDLQGNSHVLRIFVIVPHQQLCSRRKVLKCSVINVAIILKSKHVLLAPVSRTANIPHPASIVLIMSIDVVNKFSIIIYLKKKSGFLTLKTPGLKSRYRIYPFIKKTSDNRDLENFSPTDRTGQVSLEQ